MVSVEAVELTTVLIPYEVLLQGVSYGVVDAGEVDLLDMPLYSSSELFHIVLKKPILYI